MEVSIGLLLVEINLPIYFNELSGKISFLKFVQNPSTTVDGR